jgi:DNA-binding LacI/PurR family transcriptional regulator
MSTKAPTLEDIAREAGVSVATVSRVLRGYPQIAAETRTRVMSAAQRLRYQRAQAVAQATHTNGNAEDVVHKISGLQTLYVYMDIIAEKQFAPIVLELIGIGAQRGFKTVVNTCNQKDLINRVVSHEPEDNAAIAVITLSRVTEDDAERIRESYVPVVLVNRYVRGMTFSVTLDDYAAGCQAARYLFNLGHRRIACLQGDLRASSMVDRAAGFRAELLELGVYDASLFLETGGRSPGFHQRIAECMKKLLAEANPVTAVWAWNDVAASDAIVAAHSMGVCTPEKLSVMGFDAVDEESTRITSFQYSFRELAYCTVALLEMRLAGSLRQPIRICVSPTFIEGDTTAPPPTK